MKQPSKRPAKRQNIAASFFEDLKEETIELPSFITERIEAAAVVEASLSEENHADSKRGQTPSIAVNDIQSMPEAVNPSQKQSNEVSGETSNTVNGLQSRSVKRGQSRSDNLPDCELLTLNFLNQGQLDGCLRKFKRKDIAEAIGFTEGGVETALKRLRQRGLLETVREIRGRHHGGGIWRPTVEGLALLTREDVIEIIRILNAVNGGQTPPAKRGQTRPSIEDDDINSSSERMRTDDIEAIDLKPLHEIGVHLTHQILKDYGTKLKPEEMVELLNNFYADYRTKRARLCNDPVAYVIGALKKGYYRAPAGLRPMTV